MYVHTSLRPYVHTYARTYVRTHFLEYINMYIGTYVCTYVRMYVYVYACMNSTTVNNRPASNDWSTVGSHDPTEDPMSASGDLISRDQGPKLLQIGLVNPSECVLSGNAVKM